MSSKWEKMKKKRSGETKRFTLMSRTNQILKISDSNKIEPLKKRNKTTTKNYFRIRGVSSFSLSDLAAIAFVNLVKMGFYF